MQQATHFIEQYVGESTKIISSTQSLAIKFLDEALEFTAESKYLKTVAVFKIKFKKQ